MVGVRVPIYYDIPTAVVVKGTDSKLTAEDLHLWIKGKTNKKKLSLDRGFLVNFFFFNLNFRQITQRFV